MRSLALACFILCLGLPQPARGQWNLFATCQRPSPYATEQFNRVLASAGYSGSPITFCASSYVPNAVAVSHPQPQLLPNGTLTYVYSRFIMYNPAFMTQLEFVSGNRYATLGILAHELGHHIYSHADVSNWLNVLKHPWQREIEADYYSGFVMAKLGASSQDLEAAQRIIFSMWGSPTHPDTTRRIHAIASGWREGGGSQAVEQDLLTLHQRIVGELTRWHY